jgi:hypothetical protein
MTEKIKAFIFYLLSFRRRDWQLGDYPLRFRRQPDGPPWLAQIINWYLMYGAGDTREEALRDLERRLEAYRQNHPLPRPGTGAPVRVEFAPTVNLDPYLPDAADFLQRIIGLDPSSTFISDDTSLRNFDTLMPYTEICEKIRQVYGVDVTDIEDGNLVRVLERIHGFGDRN